MKEPLVSSSIDNGLFQPQIWWPDIIIIEVKRPFEISPDSLYPACFPTKSLEVCSIVTSGILMFDII